MNTEVWSRPGPVTARRASGRQAVEFVCKPRVGCAFMQLLAKVFSGKPTGTSTVRDDVSDRFAVDGKRHPLTGLDRVDHLAGSVATVTHPNLHVRQRRTVADKRTMPVPFFSRDRHLANHAR